MNASQQKKVYVTFTTSLPDEYRFEHGPISLSVSSDSEVLNKIVQSYLAEKDLPIKSFQFLIKGVILQSIIEDHSSVDPTSEKNIEVEYIAPFGEPQPDQSSSAEHEIAYLASSLLDEKILSFTFNGRVEVRNRATLEVEREVRAFKFEEDLQGSILSYAFAETEEGVEVYSGSVFGDVFLSKFRHGSFDVVRQHQAEARNSVTAMCLNSLAPILYCGDSEGFLSAFTSGDLKRSVDVKQHNLAISAIRFIDQSKIATGGRDDCVKICDAETLACATSFLLKDQAITSLEAFPRKQLIFSGHINGSLRLFDERQHSGPVRVLKAHDFLVSQIAFNSETDNSFVTASHDGLVKFWDLRSDRSLFEIDAANKRKIHALCWDQKDRLISAGEDSHIMAHKFAN